MELYNNPNKSDQWTEERNEPKIKVKEQTK
jgi:hypothetical protein